MFKKILFAVVAMLLIGVASFQLAFVEIPIAATDILNGNTITTNDVKLQKFLFSDVPQNAIKDINLIVGQMASANITKDGVFMPYLLAQSDDNPTTTPSNLDKDSILVSLIVKPENVPNSLRTGDKVKIIAFYGTGEATTKPAFTISFPHLATVHGLKKDELGGLVGVDVVTHFSIDTEIILASLKGTIALAKVHPDANSTPDGSDVDSQHNQYFYGPQMPPQTN